MAVLAARAAAVAHNPAAAVRRAAAAVQTQQLGWVASALEDAAFAEIDTPPVAAE